MSIPVSYDNVVSVQSLLSSQNEISEYLLPLDPVNVETTVWHFPVWEVKEISMRKSKLP